jgi:DNA-binding NtrC family response regulator
MRKKGLPHSPPSSSTILAVDDDPTILQLVRTVLTTAGYQVLVADSGWSAVRTYESNASPIHLLVTDVVMPDLTGPVLASRLRARQPDLRVLFISGFHDSAMVQRYANMKGFPLVPKPFTPSGLLRAVEGVLE